MKRNHLFAQEERKKIIENNFYEKETKQSINMPNAFI
jgi:hypothetical protein